MYPFKFNSISALHAYMPTYQKRGLDPILDGCEPLWDLNSGPQNL